MNLTQTHFQLLGIAVLFCIGLILAFSTAMNSFASEDKLILKTEFVKNAEELKNLVGEVGSKSREGVKSALIIDTIGFIPIYFLLFTLMSWLLSQQSGSYSKYIGLTAFIFALVAVLADLSENLNLYKSLEGIEVSDKIIYLSAIGKWVCFFITSAILSTIFWQLNRYLLIAGLFLIGSVSGIILLSLQKYELIQMAVISIILGTLIVGINFTFFSTNAENIFSGK